MLVAALLALPPALGVAGCASVFHRQPAGPQHVRLLITTDEHGWLEPHWDTSVGRETGGVIAAAEQWREVEGLGADDVVLLSVGDMWTGPYESTMLRGEPMVRAFNRLGYAAAAVGNHDFDFGTQVLTERSRQAEFPFLSANVTEGSHGRKPKWATTSTVVTAGALRIGVIGLTYRRTPETTHPRWVSDLAFGEYAAALEREVPRLRARGAHVIVLLLHDDWDAAAELLPTLQRLDIHAVGVGHVHDPRLWIDDGGTRDRSDDDTIVCNGGPFLRSYCRLDLTFDQGRLIAYDAAVVDVVREADFTDASADPELVQIVAEARSHSASRAADEVLAYAPEPIARGDGELGRFITQCWLNRFPAVDVAITNAGGIRQDLPAGKIRVRDVISMLPFKNYLVIAEISGKQLREALANPESIAAGVGYTYRESRQRRTILDVTDAYGRSIADDARVRVIVNDFMYWGGDGYRFRDYAPDAEHTPIDWRNPVVACLRQLDQSGKELRVRASDTDATDATDRAYRP